MGNFSKDNPFQPLKQYVSVRLQQGVPLVDADVNERDDIRRFELRAFLKWFIGDGVPANSSAFQILAKEEDDPPNSGTFSSDNFVISGVELSIPTAPNLQSYINAGRCLVDGQDVFIVDNVDFTQQPLYVTNLPPAGETPGAGIILDPDAEPIQPIPPTEQPITIYLDVWEWEVENTEDSELIDERIGLLTSTRIRRDWAVRAGLELPPSDDIHSYFQLATLSHGASTPIRSEDITDNRQTLNNLDFLSIVTSDYEQRITTNTNNVSNIQTQLASALDRLNELEALLLAPSFSPPPNEFNPNLGAPDTVVTLFGNNFNVGTPTVRIGTVIAEIIGTPTATQISARVPFIAAGNVQISVETVGGLATTTDTFVVLPTSISAPAPSFASTPNEFNPNLGSPNTDVTLFGNNFNVDGLSVRFGTVAATIVGTPTATEIIARVPSIPSGNVQISVETDGGTATTVDSFIVIP